MSKYRIKLVKMIRKSDKKVITAQWSICYSNGSELLTSKVYRSQRGLDNSLDQALKFIDIDKIDIDSITKFVVASGKLRKLWAKEQA